MPSPSDDLTLPDGVVWSVGDVAAALGLPTSTVRTWERRYGLSPSERTSGGHRRYTTQDVERIRRVRQLVDQGVSPSEAARSVLQAAVDEVSTYGGPGVGTAEAWSDQVLAAARTLDVAALRELVTTAVEARGVTASWDEYLSPMLRRVGEDWTSGTLEIGAEHLVSEAVLTALRARVHALVGDTRTSRPAAILASAEDDQHSLPVVALQAALAEQKVDAHAFGQRLPAAALATVVARTQPKAMFLWASIERPRGDRLHRVLSALSGKTTIVLGGPGWRGTAIPQARVATDLSSAVSTLVAAVAR